MEVNQANSQIKGSSEEPTLLSILSQLDQQNNYKGNLVSELSYIVDRLSSNYYDDPRKTCDSGQSEYAETEQQSLVNEYMDILTNTIYLNNTLETLIDKLRKTLGV